MNEVGNERIPAVQRGNMKQKSDYMRWKTYPRITIIQTNT